MAVATQATRKSEPARNRASKPVNAQTKLQQVNKASIVIKPAIVLKTAQKKEVTQPIAEKLGPSDDGRVKDEKQQASDNVVIEGENPVESAGGGEVAQATPKKKGASTENAEPVGKKKQESNGKEKENSAEEVKPATPEDDPGFQKVIKNLDASAKQAKKHESPEKKVAAAQAAAVAPAKEKEAGAKAGKVGQMEKAETRKPESQSFLSMLREQIKRLMPKKVENVKGYMKGEDRHNLKNAMTGNVAKQKGEATAGITQASNAPLNTTAIPGKQTTPLAAEEKAKKSPSIQAENAIPSPKSDKEVSMEQGKKDTNKLMSDANITTPQMDKANDSRFTAVVKEKQKADQFADAAPDKYRQREQMVREQASTDAKGDEKKGLSAFFSFGTKSLKAARSNQLTAKQKDEQERKKVTDHIQKIFDRTKERVDKKLASLDEEVSKLFDKGADDAVVKMKDYVESRFDDRYSGVIGKGKWLKDKLLPLPDFVKGWFDQAHKVFISELDALVVRVANLVENRLKEAKEEVKKGQKEIKDYVDGLPDNLKAVGKAAQDEMKSQFYELNNSVNNKKSELAQKLAQRYKSAYEKGQEALKDLKDAHKSLYERVRDAIAEVVKVLRDFKNKVLALLKKSKKAIEIIVADPIGFLKNVLAAIKKGLSQFVDNIWTHLKAGFMAWLFGSLAGAGVEVPNDFSLGSILKLVLQVLGLTYQRLRTKAVKLLGERAIGVIEKVASFIWTLVTQGPAKLWELIKEYLGNLKEMLINAIQEWLITTIIKAAVLKLVSMFNPVGAIIQAILTIYNVIMFLIERIQQIMAFVESVVNSVYEIATGAISTAAKLIEKALARTVPLIIAFLARLLGISGIAQKIVGIIKNIQKKVDSAIDKVIKKVAKGIGKVVGVVKSGVGKVVQWWKQRKKFKSASGESHEVYFKGSENNTLPMVASKDPKPIINKLDEFSKMASESKATKKMKNQSGRISNVRKLLKQLPSNPSVMSNIVTELRVLFDAFEPQSTKKQFSMKVQKTQNMKLNDQYSDTVATHMIVDWLDSKHIEGGTKPSGGALSIVMGHLISDPGQKSPDKYIKGHLLNENLGGKGDEKNLFPITGKANSQHLHSTEKIVKKWIPKGSPANKWVWYEVKVGDIEKNFPIKGKKSRKNWVNCTFYCRAVLKDKDGKEEKSFITAVPSKYTEALSAEKFEMD